MTTPGDSGVGSGVGLAVGLGSAGRVGAELVSVAVVVAVGLAEVGLLPREHPTASKSISEAKPHNKNRFITK